MEGRERILGPDLIQPPRVESEQENIGSQEIPRPAVGSGQTLERPAPATVERPSDRGDEDEPVGSASPLGVTSRPNVSGELSDDPEELQEQLETIFRSNEESS